VVNFWEWNPTGLHGPGFSVPFARVVGGSLWYKIAPVPICEASTSSSNCLEGSGLTSTGELVMSVIILSCASCCAGPYSNGASFPVSLVIGAAMIEKFLQNILWYPAMPKNPLACLRLSMSRG